MADLVLLRAELDSDPAFYDPLTDQQVADHLLQLTGTLDVTAVTPTDIYEAIVPSEYVGLTDAEKAQLSDIFSLPEVRLGGNAELVLTTTFGPGTATRTNLLGLKTIVVTLATELGIGPVHAGDVAGARAL